MSSRVPAYPEPVSSDRIASNDWPTFLIGTFLIISFCYAFTQIAHVRTDPQLGVMGVFVPKSSQTRRLSTTKDADVRLVGLRRPVAFSVRWRGRQAYLGGIKNAYRLRPHRLDPMRLRAHRESVAHHKLGVVAEDGLLFVAGKQWFRVRIGDEGVELRYLRSANINPWSLLPHFAQRFRPHALRTYPIEKTKETRFTSGTRRWDQLQMKEITVGWSEKHPQQAMVISPLNKGHYRIAVEDRNRQSLQQVVSFNVDFLVGDTIFRVERIDVDSSRTAIILGLLTIFIWAFYMFWGKRCLDTAGAFALLDVAFLIILALNLLGLALLYRLGAHPSFLDNFEYFQNKLLAFIVGSWVFCSVLAWPRLRDLVMVLGAFVILYGILPLLDGQLSAITPLTSVLLCAGVGLVVFARMPFRTVPGLQWWQRAQRKRTIPALLFFVMGLVGLLVSPLGLVKGYKISEFSKVFFILYFSLFFASLYTYFKDTYPLQVREGPQLSLWRQVWGFTLPMLLLLVIPLVLTFVFYFLANDFGPFLIFALVFATFLCFALPKFNLRWARGLAVYNLPVILLVAGIAVSLVYHRQILLWAHGMFADLGITKITQRIETFFQPWRSSAGEHIAEILWYGTGSQLAPRYVPNMHSDLIFAELLRLGVPAIACYVVVNALLVVALFFYARRLFLTHQGTRQPGVAPAFVAVLAIHYWVAQHFVNIGATLGFSLMTGLTLPFLSYGGTSTLSWFMLLAVVFRQWRHLSPLPHAAAQRVHQAERVHPLTIHATER